MGQESWQPQQGAFGSGSLTGFNQEVIQGCNYLKAWLSQSVSKLTHMAVNKPQVLAGSWSKISIPCHMDLSIEQLIKVLASIKAGEWEQEQERMPKMEATVFL